MVKVFAGHKGSGKTKKMIHLANDMIESANGSIVFINKNHRLMYDLKYQIRVVCMEDFEHITNIDEYIGFIYGIISSDHDIEAIFIDGILRHEDVHIPDLNEFFERLRNISEDHELDFVVSVSADLDELGDILKGCEIDGGCEILD
ncbi:hypothetical protein MASR2M70_04340 [Bacillota bacterium]